MGSHDETVERLQLAILEILGISPESFPVIHYELAEEGVAIEPRELSATLRRMAEQNLVRVYYPRNVKQDYWADAESALQSHLAVAKSREDFPPDLGPWLEMMPKGREALDEGLAYTRSQFRPRLCLRFEYGMARECGSTASQGVRACVETLDLSCQSTSPQ